MNTLYGSVYFRGADATATLQATPTIDNSVAVSNLGTAGTYNLLLNNVAGSYSHINMDGAADGSIYFGNDPVPTSWDSGGTSTSAASRPQREAAVIPASRPSCRQSRNDHLPLQAPADVFA